VFTLGAASRSTPAQDDTVRATLKGITAVFVLVESLPDGAKKLGLSDETIQSDVELKLRLAGLRVVTVQEGLQVPGSPYLYVNLNVMDDAGAASIEIDFNQDATLERNGQHASGVTTWHKGMVVQLPSGQGTREHIKDLTDAFLNDWLAANPKK
jgi:hypothetical protein